jgi:hypothetical protein
MEIPANIQQLYRHWSFHAGKPPIDETDQIFKSQQLRKELFWFIAERIKIWEQKVSGKQPPFTDDNILSKYRFCNIFREFDRQTIAFHRLLNPLRKDFSLWLLNMFYCRMVARPETIEKIGLLSYDKKENKKLYSRLLNSTRPRFGTAYVFPISVIQKSMTPTREQFIAEYLPTVMKSVAHEITTWQRKNVIEGLARIIPIFNFNLRFLWTEVLIDVAYQFPEHIDLFGLFPVGPGALPTMQKINKTKQPEVLVQELATVGFKTGLSFNGEPLRLSAESWEGIGCEFRKYTNLKAGRGRKRLFTSVT